MSQILFSAEEKMAFCRFHEVVGTCDLLCREFSLQNIPRLTVQLNLLLEVWEDCIPCLNSIDKEDANALYGWMKIVSGDYGPKTITSFAFAIKSINRIADSIVERIHNEDRHDPRQPVPRPW